MNETALNRLQKDGFLVMEGLVGTNDLNGFHGAFKERMTTSIAVGGGMKKSKDEINLVYVDHPMTLHPAGVRFALDKSITRLVEDYLRSPIVLSYTAAYRTKVISIKTRTKAYEKPGVFSGWHSDANLIAPDRGYRFVMSMMYLNDVSIGGGALQVIRGSHTYGSEKRKWTTDEIEARRQDIVEVNAPAGSVVVFDMQLIHRAGIPTETERDVFRCCYVHKGGYGEPIVFSNDMFPPVLNREDARILRLGQENSIPLSLSELGDYNSIIKSAPGLQEGSTFGTIDEHSVVFGKNLSQTLWIRRERRFLEPIENISGRYTVQFRLQKQSGYYPYRQMHDVDNSDSRVGENGD